MITAIEIENFKGIGERLRVLKATHAAPSGLT
jgi:hypothetical protein